MKGQLNEDGYVMDFGDVKNVLFILIELFIVCTYRMQEIKSEIPITYEKWCSSSFIWISIIYLIDYWKEWKYWDDHWRQ